MDLLNLLRLFLRHKIVVAVAIVASGCLLAYAYLGAPPVYRASGSVVLLNPPVAPATTLPGAGAPTTASNPSARSETAFESPFVRYRDLSVVVDILVRVVRRPDVDVALRSRGLTGTYAVTANVDFQRGPFVDVAAEAGSAAAAQMSARLVIAELGTQLLKLQADQGTDPAYSIRTFTVVSAERATTVFSSSLRRLIAVAALCGISTVGAVTLAETLSVWRRGDRSPRARPHRAQRPGERSRRQRDAAASEPDQRRAHGTGGEPSAIEAP